MADIRIIKTVCALSETTEGWQKELNIVSVDGGPFQYDIREWRLDHFDYRDGISLDEKEAAELMINQRDYSLVFSAEDGSLLQYRDPRDIAYELRFAKESEAHFFHPCIDNFKVQCNYGLSFSVCLPNYGRKPLVLYFEYSQPLRYPYLSVQLKQEDFTPALLENLCAKVPMLFRDVN